MEINGLNLALQNFIINSNSKSILIDGPWGCGKTYQIKEFIKTNKKEKIYYLSLFGLESIDEINTALYQQTRKVHRFFKYSANLISKVITAFPTIPNIADALEYQLGLGGYLNVKNKSIIVLDDLERLSDKIKYSDLMGYINFLYLSGCRFICLMSSQNVQINRKKDFDDFKEKVFDCIYKINNFNADIVKDFFKEYEMINIEEVFYLFESNLRLVQKTKRFYEKVFVRIKNNNNRIDFSEQLILKACIYTVNICFKSNEYKPKENDIFFDDYCERFGNDIAKNIYYYKNNEVNKNDFIIPNFLRIVESLIFAFYYQDFTNFDEIYFISNSSGNNILNREFYYLSDDNKKAYINEFKKLILTKKTEWNDRNGNILRNILMFSDYEFDPNIIEEIALLINDKKDFRKGVRWILQIDRENSNARIEKFIEKIEQNLKKIRKDELINKFNKSWDTKNFIDLKKLLEIAGICKDEEKNEFLDYIISNDFFIPDISGDINETIWTYCHSMARFAKKNDKSNLFINVLTNTHKDKKTQSELDRFYSLIKYNIDSTIDIETLR